MKKLGLRRRKLGRRLVVWLNSLGLVWLGLVAGLLGLVWLGLLGLGLLSLLGLLVFGSDSLGLDSGDLARIFLELAGLGIAVVVWLVTWLRLDKHLDSLGWDKPLIVGAILLGYFFGLVGILVLWLGYSLGLVMWLWQRCKRRKNRWICCPPA